MLVGVDRKSKNNSLSCCIEEWEANFTKIKDVKWIKFNKVDLTCCQKSPGWHLP